MSAAPLCLAPEVKRLTGATRRALQQITRYEEQVHATMMTRLLRVIGRTRLFALFYRMIGPRVDPLLMRRTRLIGSFYGLNALLLTTTGARSGKKRTAPLLYVREGDDFVVVGTNFGQRNHPAWTTNLLANPNAEIEIAGTRINVKAELADAATWALCFLRFVEVYPGYQDYLARCPDRTPRMFVLRA